MILAVYGLITALFVSLSGNGARLVGAVAARIGAPASLLLCAILAQAAIIAMMLAAGVALRPALDHWVAQMLASGLLALGVLLVLRPYPVAEPVEPTHSLGAISLVTAAYAIRDGLAPLALALGLVATDLTGLSAGMVLGAGVAITLALRAKQVGAFQPYARALAAVALAGGAFWFGALAG